MNPTAGHDFAPRILSLLSAWIILGLIQGHAEASADPNARSEQANDCGVRALYLLADLEGSRYTLSEIQNALGEIPARGFSMEDLRDAALRLGLKLEGAKLRDDIRSIDRPMIVLARRGEHYHYVVVRPVGSTGRLAQILDSAWNPEILPIEEMLASSDWTGLALIPERPNWPARIAGGVAIASGALLAGMGVRGLGGGGWGGREEGLTKKAGRAEGRGRRAEGRGQRAEGEFKPGLRRRGLRGP
jgi:hypothetical protein